MKRALHPLWLLVLLAACQSAKKDDSASWAGRVPHEFPAVDDNIAHDTLLIQTTFDMGDGSYLMVAGNVEDTFEGLRLYRYRPTSDSAAQMIAISSPAYDSWTMLPTFFPVDSTRSNNEMWVLANFGEKESWGQKLLYLDTAFHDLGFLDAALPERVLEDDTLRLKRRSIGPFMRYALRNDTAIWRFACDSVFLYDDQEGGFDRVVHASRLRFTYHPVDGLSLWFDGVRRPVKVPA